MIIFNEYIFLIHILIVSIFSAIALRLKKEALFSLICVQAILANIFVTKQIILAGFCVTCTDIFTVGISLCLNFLQEFYDKKTSIKAIWTSFFCLIFYVLMSQIHLFYIPAEIDTFNDFFIKILSPMPRIILASIFAYLISQYTDTFVYGFFKNRLNNKFFILKNYGSILISQLIDTAIFSFLGLYSLVNNIWDIFIVSFFIKAISIIIIVPLASSFIKKIK
jgi:queuosine precursor transporter